MKKSTLLFTLFILLNSFVAPARVRQQNQQFQNSTLSSGIKHTNAIQSFTSFYSEDFAGGLPSGWLSTDSAGNGVKWDTTSTGASVSNDSLSVTGTTATNGYMILDSDASGNSVGGENADLISDSINCSSHPNVHLTFNEYLKHYNDTATVLISNDGINWTEVYNASAGLAVYGSTSNPHNVDIDISSIAANQATVYIRFNYRADYSFYWMVDDVQLYEAPASDASVTDILAPSTSCALLTATEPVSVNIFNSGGATINGGLTVTFIADNGTPVTENVTDTIASGSNLVYTFTATADFSAAGNHTITASVALTNDTITANNSVTETLFNGPHIVNTSTTYHNGFETSEDLTGLFIEDVNNDSTSFEVSTLLPNSGNNSMLLLAPTADDWFFTTCLDLDSSIVYKLTYYYRKTSSVSQVNLQIQIGNIQSAGGMSQEIFPTSPLNSLIYQQTSVVFSVFTSDVYYIGFHVTNADSVVGFAIDDINVGPDSGVGISKINNTLISLYPNPSTGIVYVNAQDIANKGYTVEVLSPVGQLVYSEPANALKNYEINLQEQPAGIYMVRVISENGISTRKISITH